MTSTPDDPTTAAPRIIRRHPTGPIPVSPAAETAGDDTSTRIIRRAPVRPGPVPPRRPPGAGSAVAAAALSILSGWPTAVVATDLVTGWWRTDPLYCLAVGFLALIFAASTVTGVILLLTRRPLGRFLIAVGSGVALLMFGSVFLAGARVGWPVYLVPALPLAALLTALAPATARWASAGS